MSSETIRVFPLAFPSPWTYESIVIVPPRLAERSEDESALLSLVSYWVIPAFEGGFSERADGKTFLNQIRRKDGWHVPVMNGTRLQTSRKSFKD